MKRLILYDIKNGIISYWRRYLFVAFFAILTDGYCHYTAKGISEIFHTDIQVSWLDYMINMFHGMKKYIPVQNQKFELPIVYIALGILLAVLIGDYAQRDLKKQGLQVLIRTESRLKWMISKIIWSILVVLCFYGILILINAVFAQGRGGFNQLLCESLIGTDWPISGNQKEILILIIIMPILTGMALVQVQMLFSLLVSPLIGFLAVVTLEFLSAYVMSPVLIGNFSMIQRYRIFINDGMQITTAVTVDLGVMILCIILQILFFQKKAIIN